MTPRFTCVLIFVRAGLYGFFCFKSKVGLLTDELFYFIVIISLKTPCFDASISTHYQITVRGIYTDSIWYFLTTTFTHCLSRGLPTALAHQVLCSWGHMNPLYCNTLFVHTLRWLTRLHAHTQLLIVDHWYCRLSKTSWHLNAGPIDHTEPIVGQLLASVVVRMPFQVRGQGLTMPSYWSSICY